MARYYVEKDGEWNVFSTIVDDFIFDEFVCLEALKAYLVYERYKELTEDINSLLTDRPRVNVMAYEEAVKRIRKTEPTISKMEQVDEPQTGYCNECKWYGDKQVCGRCRNRNLYAPKDEPRIATDEDLEDVRKAVARAKAFKPNNFDEPLTKCDLCKREGDDICLDCERKGAKRCLKK